VLPPFLDTFRVLVPGARMNIVWTISKMARGFQSHYYRSRKCTHQPTHENGYVENEDSLKGRRERQQGKRHFLKSMQLEFHPSGRCTRRGALPDGEPQAIFGIGAWESLPWCCLYYSFQQTIANVFHANLHLNPFGNPNCCKESL
jgi:hypothetical protein